MSSSPYHTFLYLGEGFRFSAYFLSNEILHFTVEFTEIFHYDFGHDVQKPSFYCQVCIGFARGFLVPRTYFTVYGALSLSGR
jgi:hypothetical protein